MSQELNHDLRRLKQEARRGMRTRRDALGLMERDAASGQIQARLRELLHAKNAVAGKKIALYLATEREANITELVVWLRAQGTEVLAPFMQPDALPFYTLAPEASNLEIVEFGGKTLRAPREYSGGRARGPQELDVICVPGLAFDLQGNRLGQGGGWYDRVLAQAPDALKIGVCFETQILQNVPHEPHDIAMNFVVTEQRTIEARTIETPPTEF